MSLPNTKVFLSNEYNNSKKFIFFFENKIINRKFELSYSLLTEAPLSHPKLAGTQKIKVKIGGPNGINLKN